MLQPVRPEGTATPAEADLSGAERTGIYGRIFKRALDIFLVLAAAPMVGPVILLLALLVRSDGGPAFYSQKRVGKDGKLFNLWKLRSMVVDADAALAGYLESDPAAKAEWDKTQKLKNDPRITRWGGVLRKSSLDELPQLWNVLRGDMSLVGPRPFLPEQTEMYPGGAYFLMRPGLTCFWQTGDRNDSSFAARAIDDARYAREMSLGTDVSLIFKTFGVMLRQTGV